MSAPSGRAMPSDEDLRVIAAVLRSIHDRREARLRAEDTATAAPAKAAVTRISAHPERGTTRRPGRFPS
jgi:hypothetical protein